MSKDLRLAITNKLIEAVKLDREILQLSSIDSYLRSSFGEEKDETVVDYRGFAALKKGRLEALMDKRQRILKSLCAFQETPRANLEAYRPDECELLFAWNDAMSNIWKSIEQDKHDREKYENLVRTILGKLNQFTAIEGSGSGQKNINDLLGSLERLLKIVRQSKNANKLNIPARAEDPDLALRLARIHNGITDIRSSHSKCFDEIERVKEGIREANLPTKPFSVDQKCSGTIETMFMLVAVDFFKKNQEHLILELDGIFPPLKVHASKSLKGTFDIIKELSKTFATDQHDTTTYGDTDTTVETGN